jgi:hypothetical protein
MKKMTNHLLLKSKRIRFKRRKRKRLPKRRLLGLSRVRNLRHLIYHTVQRRGRLQRLVL